MTTKQYFEMRFDRRIRYFGSVLFIVGMILYLPVAIYVPALTFNQVTGINIHVITPIVCIVCTFYSCVGGLKAVIWTDVIQSFVMYGSLLAVCVKGTMDVGGLGVVLERNEASGRLNAPDMTWDPTVRLSMLSVLVGGTLHKIQSSDVNQISIQRFLSLPTLKKVKQTMILFTILLIFLLSCCCYMGLVTYATYHDCDPLSTKLARASDQLPSLLMMRTLGGFPGAPGLFVAGVFSAALSSLSTGLNSLACVISQDVVKPLLPNPLSERGTAILLRLIVIFFGIGCIALVLVVEKLGMVLELSTMVSAVSMGPLLGVYIMGVGLPWINAKSALTGSIVSFLSISWIIANAQLAQVRGEIKYPKMPVSVEGCTYSFNHTTMWSETVDYTPSVERNIYHLSFFWYTALGGVICIIFAGLASFIFGTNKLDDINPKLLSPLWHKYLEKREYKTVLFKDSDEQEKYEKYPKDCGEYFENISLKYLEKRFDRKIRLLCSILYIILSILYLPISIYVPALTFNQVTGFGVHQITPVVVVICTIYTCIGGFKGVIWTDVLQAFIMVGTLMIVVVKGTLDVGGVGVVYQRNLDSGRIVAPDMTLDPTVRMSMFSLFVGGTLYKLQIAGVGQPTVQRYVSLPDMKSVKKAVIYFTSGLSFLLGLCMYLGMLAYAEYYDCDPITTKLTLAKDQIVPLYVTQVAGSYTGFVGLFVAAVFSAALSSISTLLNSLSGVILKDFVEPFRKEPLSERQTAIILRSVVLVFGLSALANVRLVEKLGMVMQLSATVGSMTSGPVLGAFTAGMLMPFVNAKSILTGCSVAASFMSYVGLRAQFAIASGELKYPMKPVSVEGCDYDFVTPTNSSIYEKPQVPFEKGIHHMSFLLYTALGATITIVVALLATLVFGRQDTSEVDPNLIVPFLRRYLKPRKYTAVYPGDILNENSTELKKLNETK